jgi:spore coat polysaccharide biosynthesis protein SpsF (cytidylyltransferase family)
MVELKSCYVISSCRDVSLRIKNKLLLKIKDLESIDVTLHTNKKLIFFLTRPILYTRVYHFIFFSY